jgi:endonuclease YncB( thermonuclease family)
MRKVDGWQTLATSPIDQPIDLAAWSNTISFPETAPRKIPTTSRAPSAVIIATSGVVAVGEPLKFSDIYVVDGDTIEALGKRIRLVGFDAPELGDHAHCGLERMLAARATSRLR